MALDLKTDSRSGLNLSAETEVLNYTYAGSTPVEVEARVQAGVPPRTLSGVGGTYTVNFYINGVVISPASQVTVLGGVLTTILASRTVPLVSGESVSVRVRGLAGDTNVDTVTILRDVTPIRASDIVGAGLVLVDHNYGGADALTYQTAGGQGIAGATILAFLADDYNLGNRSAAYVLGRSTTDSNGRWTQSMGLGPGTYVLLYSKPGQYGPNTKALVVQ